MTTLRFIDRVLPAALLVSLWPVWRWYGLRMADGSDEKWGLLALATLAVLVLSRRGKWGASSPPLPAAAVILLLYTVSYPFLLPLARAMIAVSAIGIFVGSWGFGNPLHAGTWGLLMLALPVIASMQYYLGYPLRVLTGRASAFLLTLAGLAVSSSGTSMKWMGETVVVDAPCSGVHMLWVGAWLALTLACLYELSTGRTILSAGFSVAAVLVGNIIRAAILFYKEAGIVHWPAWTHEAVGVAIFCVVSGAIFGWVYLIKGRPQCRQGTASSLSV